MAKVNVKIQGEISRSFMKRINPILKKKKITIQEAVDKGMKEETPTGYLNMACVLAAIKGLGLKL